MPLLIPSVAVALLVQVAPGSRSSFAAAFGVPVVIGTLSYVAQVTVVHVVLCFVWFAFVFVHMVHVCPSVFTVFGVRVDVCVSLMFDVLTVCALCSWFCVLTHHATNVDRNSRVGGRPPQGQGRGTSVSTSVSDTPLLWSSLVFQLLHSSAILAQRLALKNVPTHPHLQGYLPNKLLLVKPQVLT